MERPGSPVLAACGRPKSLGVWHLAGLTPDAGGQYCFMGLWDRLKALNATLSDPSKDPKRWWWGVAVGPPLAVVITVVAIFQQEEQLWGMAAIAWVTAATLAFQAGYQKGRYDEQRKQGPPDTPPIARKDRSADPLR